jgi:hypothetical protein
MAGNKVDIGARLVAHCSRGNDTNATWRILFLFKPCGHSGGTFRAHGVVGLDFNEREIE